MLTGDFNDTLVTYIQDENIEGANKALMTELANILLKDKNDFVDMLNESGVEADLSMSNAQLIELFIDNTDNKELLIGASLLAQHHNQKSGFDGESEVSDENVKSGVAVMNSYFNDVIPDEEYSYIAPFLIGPIMRGAQKILNKKLSNRDKQKVGAGYSALAERQMREQVALKRKLEAERKQRELEQKKAKAKLNTAIIIGSGVVLTIIVGAIIYVKRR